MIVLIIIYHYTYRVGLAIKRQLKYIVDIKSILLFGTELLEGKEVQVTLP